MRMVLLTLVLVAAACGAGDAGDAGDGAPATTTATVADTTLPAPLPGNESIETPAQPASRDPQPVSEPILTPVPRPAPEPVKPARPNLPTPPPPRSAPDDPEPIAEDAIRTAIGDLAWRLGVAEGAIELLDARQVTWRDGSVGCPDPDLAYTQAAVPGSLIVLRAGDSSYRFHAAGDGPFFYCETPQAPLEGGA